MHTSLIRESPGVDRNHFSQLFVEVMDTQNCEAELFGRLCEKTLSRSLPEWVQEEGLPGGCDSQCLQQQTLADIWALAALQREHVLLRGGKGDLRSQAHELPWTLVRLLFPHKLLSGIVSVLKGNYKRMRERKTLLLMHSVASVACSVKYLFFNTCNQK